MFGHSDPVLTRFHPAGLGKSQSVTKGQQQSETK